MLLANRVIKVSGNLSIFKNRSGLMVSFKDTHYPKDIILRAGFHVSYRDFEKVPDEIGIFVYLQNKKSTYIISALRVVIHRR
jgi:hypothetical protein